jgi:hypothetical protein
MTDWIKHEPGACPIPDAKAGEFEIMWEGKPFKVHDSLDAEDAMGWTKGYITHYRLLPPAVAWQAIADELADVLKAVHPDPHYDYSALSQAALAKYQKAKGN